MIVCQTLGPPLVRLADGTTPTDLQWQKNLALLVYLARSPKRTRTRDHLVALLWGDKEEAKARHSLTHAVATLGKFAPGSVKPTRTHVRLSERVTLDVDQMEALAARGDYEAAARLIVGPFLDGVRIDGASEFDDWLSTERAYWQRRSVEVLVAESARALSSGDLETAEQTARAAEELDPSSGVATRALLRALALVGDRGRALATFTAFTERLKRDGDGKPDAETEALAARIRDDRALRLQAPRSESRRAPLVGRSAELDRLVGTWDRCRQRAGGAGGGRGGVVLIEGHGGTGKSRLADELAGRARLDGAVVTAVRVVEADQTDPWSGVLGIARGGLLDARGIAAASPGALAELRSTTPAGAPARALSEAMLAVADEQPLLVVVDDAHWLDRESLLALGAAARDIARAPVLFVLTASPQLRRGELDEIRAHIGRELAGAVVVLSALAGEDLQGLARWAVPAYDRVQLERLSRRLVADSAGIPLLAIELLHAVTLGLDLQQLTGAWPEPLRTLEQTLPGDLPDALTAAIRVNFHRLSSGAQRVLVVAAVLKGRVSPAQLAQASGISGEALTAALDELEWQRWLAAEARGYAFVAKIVRDVIDRDMVLSAERQRIISCAPPSRSR